MQATEDDGFSTSSQRIRCAKGRMVARRFVIISNDYELWLEKQRTEKESSNSGCWVEGLLRNQEGKRYRVRRPPWSGGGAERGAISRKAFVCLKVFLSSATAAHLNVLFLRPSEYYQTVIIWASNKQLFQLLIYISIILTTDLMITSRLWSH